MRVGPFFHFVVIIASCSYAPGLASRKSNLFESVVIYRDQLYFFRR